MAVEAPVKPAKSAIDWQAADSIAVKLGGRVPLDAAEPDDREFFERLALGQDVELVVAGAVVSVAAIAVRDRFGDFLGFNAVRVINLPLSSSREDALALLLGADSRRLCGCGCGCPAAREYRPGHARRRNGESISHRMLAKTRNPELLDDEKPCAGCAKTMRRSDFPRLSDRKWQARRLCSRRCPGATRQANIALAAR